MALIAFTISTSDRSSAVVIKPVELFDIEIPVLLLAAMQITDKAKYNDYAANKETILKAQQVKEQKELKAIIADLTDILENPKRLKKVVFVEIKSNMTSTPVLTHHFS